MILFIRWNTLQAILEVASTFLRISHRIPNSLGYKKVAHLFLIA